MFTRDRSRPVAALFLSASFSALTSLASGCGGCGTGTLECDASGLHCMVCDGYGCTPATEANRPGPISTPPGQSGPEVSGSGGGVGSDPGSAGSASTGGAHADHCDPKELLCSCETTSECQTGACVEGLCITACEFSYQCESGFLCADGACVTACLDGECQPGSQCENGICVADPMNPACSTALPCSGDNELCLEGICQAVCESNEDCTDGKLCSAATLTCIANPSTKTACSDDEPCPGLGQQCWSDGYCHYPCNTLEQCKHIDTRFSTCDEGICKTPEEENPECTFLHPCPDDASCISNHCEAITP